MLNNNFSKIGVLYGGTSAEREVSINSGLAIHKALVAEGINAELFDVGSDFINKIQNKNFDFVFIALHGRGGEDGTIQAVLDWLEIPYTGSGVLASAISMDKVKTKQIWKANNLPVLPQIILEEGFNIDLVVEKIGFPMAVKPALEGSSVGIFKVENKSDLESAFINANKFNSVVMAEKWVEGDELTAAIIADEAMPLIRIKMAEGFYDYNAKYVTGATAYECPCGLDSNLEEQIKELAKKAAKCLGVFGWCRVDIMLDADNNPWLLEINTIPGMTETSLVPKAAKSAGYSFNQIVVKILNNSMERYNA